MNKNNIKEELIAVILDDLENNGIISALRLQQEISIAMGITVGLTCKIASDIVGAKFMNGEEFESKQRKVRKTYEQNFNGPVDIFDSVFMANYLLMGKLAFMDTVMSVVSASAKADPSYEHGKGGLDTPLDITKERAAIPEMLQESEIIIAKLGRITKDQVQKSLEGEE